MSDGARPPINIRTLRILISLWKLQGLQTRMTLELASGNADGVRELSEEIRMQLESVGEKIDLEIDGIEAILNAKEAPDGGN